MPWREQILRRDAGLRERARGGRVTVSAKQDPLAGAPLDEVEVLFKLADPAGARVPLGKPLAAAAPPLPLASAAAPCPVALAEARERLTRMQSAIAAQSQNPDRIFSSSPPNERLTAEMKAIAARAVGGAGPAIDIQCRGPVCRLGEPADAASRSPLKQPWFRQLSVDPEYRRDWKGMMSVGLGVVYVQLARPAQR